MSHPDVSFKFINNGQTKLHTSGNGNEKDLIYHIYGRDITAAVLKVEHETELFKLRGFIGKPIISRGNPVTMRIILSTAATSKVH